MRVALVYKRFAVSGGSERQLLMLSRYLIEQGDEVHVFCASRRDPVPEGVSLHQMHIGAPGHLPQLIAFSRWARRAISDHEARHGPFDVRHAFGRTLGQDVYRVGGGFHRTYLEHAHALGAPPWLRSLLVRTPYQVLKARMEEQALLAPTTQAIITNSAMTRDDLLANLPLSPERIHVVRNGVDLDRFRPAEPGEREAVRAEIGIAPSAPVALFLGTGFERKGLLETLRAVRRLRSSHPEALLLVVGRDADAHRWSELAESLGVRGAARFLGPRSDPERLLRASDVYVLPTAYDPAANTTLEAIACGIPVITSSMNGAAEIVDESFGTVVPNPVHPSDVAAALARWLDRPADDGAAIAERARRAAELHPAHVGYATMREIYVSVATENESVRAA